MNFRQSVLHGDLRRRADRRHFGERTGSAVTFDDHKGARKCDSHVAWKAAL